MSHDEEMSQLLSIVSHDLRSPLTALLLGSRFAQRETALSEQGRQVISEMEDAAEDLQRRLYDAIDLLRAVHGRLQLQSATVELSDLLRGLVRDAQRKARQRQLAFDLSGPQVYVRGEGQVLPRALFALIDHAVQSAPPSSSVALEVSSRDGGGLVRVTDEGPRLTAVDRVFEQAPSTDGARQIGGIGLALARSVAALLGGRTWAEQPPRAGATLCIWLPLAP